MAKRKIDILITARDNASSKFKKADKAVGNFQATLAGIGGGAIAGVAIGALTSVLGVVKDLGLSFADLTKDIVELGDAFGKSAKRIGVTAEEYQKLAFAARRAGATNGDVERGFKRMASTIFDAERGVKESVDTLNVLQIKLEDIQNISPEQQFAMIADSLNAVEDASTKAAIAQDVFGRAGTQLIPMLSEYRDLAKEIEGLGGIIDEDAVSAAENFKDQMESLTTVAKALVANSGLLQFLSDTATTMTQLATNTDLAKDALRDYGVALAKAISPNVGKLLDQDTGFVGLGKLGDPITPDQVEEANRRRKAEEARNKAINEGAEERARAGRQSVIAEIRQQEALERRGELLSNVLDQLSDIADAEREAEEQKKRINEQEAERLRKLQERRAEAERVSPFATTQQQVGRDVRFLRFGQEGPKVPREVKDNEKNTKQIADSSKEIAEGIENLNTLIGQIQTSGGTLFPANLGGV
jgi:hypothetical protein